MPRKRKYTDQDLIENVPKATSFRELCRILGIAESGAGYTNLQRIVKRLNLNTDHFVAKKVPKPRRIPLEKVFSNEVYMYSSRLKKRLFSEGYFEKICSQCLLSTWLNKPMPLELDHIDGNPTNNSLENLRILCPNCHAQTDTYRGKNIGNKPYDS